MEKSPLDTAQFKIGKLKKRKRLRDAFAAAALQGMSESTRSCASAAQKAYNLADAMLAERKLKKEKKP